MGEFHCGHGLSVLALRLADVMHPDPSHLGLVQDGLEFVAEEHADFALIAEIAAEVGEERIPDDDIELGSGDESLCVGQEWVSGADGLGAEVKVLLKDRDVADAHVEPLNDASEGFREVALVVLGLHDTDAEWAHWSDAEEVFA